MWSRKATALAGCGAFLALSGLVLLNYLFISVGIVMLSFLFLASFLNLWMPRVTIERTTSSDNIFEDGELEVSFTLRNRGLLGGFVEIYDEVPPQARLARGSNYTLLYLKGRQEVSFAYTVRMPLRGHYHLGPVRLRVKDAFDLFYNERHEPALEPFSVFPRIEGLESEILGGKNPKLYQGAMPIYSIGEGSQFYSLREFLPGDSMRKVNWKALARTGRMMVNETERENIIDIYMLLDARGVSGVGTPTDNPLEMCCRPDHFSRRRVDATQCRSANVLPTVDTIQSPVINDGRRVLTRQNVVTAPRLAQPATNDLGHHRTESITGGDEDLVTNNDGRGTRNSWPGPSKRETKQLFAGARIERNDIQACGDDHLRLATDFGQDR